MHTEIQLPSLLVDGFLPIIINSKLLLLTPNSCRGWAGLWNSQYFKKQNFIVTSNSYFDILYDNDIAKIDLDYLFEVISNMDLGEAEAVFLSCTNLPALNIIDKIYI